MKKTFFILLTFMLCGLTMSAQTVSESVAQSRAAAFFANQAQRVRKAPGRVSNNQQLTLAYTARKDGNTFFYVYNRGENDGYVIVGGDEQAKEILAFVPQGHFVYDSLPDNLKWWLDQYAHEIDTAIIMTANMPASAKKAMRKTTTQNTMQDIPDLITTKWNQDEPYNIAIPLVIDDGDTLSVATGCVPTALAQIMNYWEYPTHGIGSKSYSTTYSDINQTITFSVDFANTTYDWNHMRDTYVEGQFTEQEAQAVATLMYHIGVALEVSYGNSTGYTPIDQADGIQGTTGLMRDLPKYFGYDQGIEELRREDFTLDQWKTLIYNELAIGRPVYYSGVACFGGHAFVCHGYSSSLDMFSFNWGWGGQDDGYYALSGTDAVHGFTETQELILIGIRPAGYNTTSSHLCYGDKFLYNNVWYKVYDEQNRQVEVTHPEIVNTQEQTFNQNEHNYCQGEVIIPSVVEHNGISYTVSRIGSYAFLVGNNGATNITSISLPSSIKSLGAGAFYYCQSITDSIILPDDIEVIPQRCFEQCNRSPYISIPDSLKSIGFAAFFDCRLLEQITLPEGCYKLSPFAFYNCSRLSIVNLPSTMRIFGDNSFNGTSLLKMTFPCDSFVSAEYYTEGDYTTRNGVSPFPISIENGILYVPSALVDTFRNTMDEYWSKWGTVASLDSVNPNIGKRFVIDEFEYQIYNDSCVKLSGVDHVDYSKNTMIVPSSVPYEGSQYKVEAIAAGAFKYQGFGVGGIDKLILSEGIRLIGETAFECSRFRTIELPNSLEKIGRDAFNSCMELESLEIPGSVKIVQGIHQCLSLKQIILHEGAICLGPNFVAACPKLEHAFFPKSVEYSAGGTLCTGGSRVDCESLKSIVSLTDSLSVVPYKFEWNEEAQNKIGEWVEYFGLGYGTNYESVKLYVPDSLLQNPHSDYNNNYPWDQFPNKLSYVAMTSFDIPDSMSVVQQEEFIIPAQFYPANASYQMLKWTSSDESIVSVNCEGVAFAHNVGQAVITASAIDGSTLSHTCVIDVHEMTIPTDSASFYTYLLSNVFMSVHNMRFDTIAIPITCNGSDVFVAFELHRQSRSNSLYFSMAGQTFEIFSPSLREDQDMVLRFSDVESIDTLWIKWKDDNPDGSAIGTAIVSNLRVWNKYSTRYHVQFVNDDSQVLQDSLYQYGSMPTYTGPTPTKAATAQYTYTFAGWSPEVVSVTSDAAYTATFDSIVNKYTITFKNGEQELQSTEVEYGQVPAFNGTTPTKQADAQYTYTFAGWSPEVVAVTGAATYTAIFNSTVNKYTITWKQDDGSLIDQAMVEYGQVPTHATPTKQATAEFTYTFEGWSPNVVAVAGDAEYVATYTATRNSYTITWKSDDGSTIDQTTVEYGQTPTHAEPVKAATAQYTYTFAGWSPNIVSVTSDAVYTATFDSIVNKYTIIFMNGEQELQSTEVEYGQVPAFNGTTPTKPSDAQYTYTFTGWSPEIVAVAGDATYTATFSSTLRKYIITFLDEDGTELKSEQIKYGEMPVAPANPSKQATAEYTYTFAGWTPNVVAVTGDATYTATFNATKNSYTITWQNEDGSLIDQTTVEYGIIPTHAEPTKEATAEYTYTFAGWTPEVVAITGDATYKATFNSTKNKYLIVFQDEDGTELKSEQIEYGEMPIAPAAPSKEPTSEYIYTFAGWTPEIVVVTENATYTATYDATPVSEGIEDINAEDLAPRKVMINGHVFILRGNKVYTLQGQEIK